jgi:hypothetical protein
MTTPEIEPPVPREQLNLEPFTEDERIRLTEAMLDEAFMDPPNRRAQIAGACAILRRPEDPLQFTYVAIAVFLGGLSPAVAIPPRHDDLTP